MATPLENKAALPKRSCDLLQSRGPTWCVGADIGDEAKDAACQAAVEVVVIEFDDGA
jgi:hypothetical protein